MKGNVGYYPRNGVEGQRRNTKTLSQHEIEQGTSRIRTNATPGSPVQLPTTVLYRRQAARVLLRSHRTHLNGRGPRGPR